MGVEKSSAEPGQFSSQFAIHSLEAFSARKRGEVVEVAPINGRMSPLAKSRTE